MSRIPRISPAALTDEQRGLYESITAGPRARNPFGIVHPDGTLAGPFNAMLLTPPVGDALQRLGAALRHGGELSDRARELAILMVAASRESGYEQFAHEHVGRQLGLTDDEITALREGREPELADPEEQAIVATTRRLVDNGKLTDEDYADAVSKLGAAKLFELSTVVGYYQLIAMQLHVFGVDRPQ
ncbi:carboxymuconolactone decarboxylase family protein [Amycolatopsis sp. NPDC051372]|uniref:carboxymuconolactone decarboxylase family protein n=1 Tax=Amycolatopsis sp. NPDC051372 TaxID=3155669 RepID=UPI00343995E9